MSRIRTIVIVGGGTAGWMAATYLAHRTDCAITLVESPDVETVGVGEATIPPMVNFVRNLGLDEDEFMRRCHATYKLGIRFDGWTGEGESYWHPFGIAGMIDDVDLFHFWLKARRDGRFEEPYAALFPQMVLGERERAPRTETEPSIIVRRGAYAYHLDAGALAVYLKEIATSKGVEHVHANVREVTRDDRGFIGAVATDAGRELSADLFVDCTGFRGLLIEGALGEPHVDWSGTLLCDRAVVVRVPVGGEMPPFTRATALDAGWAWRIPLANRTGCGYVYSSAHSTESQATDELLRHARGIPLTDPMHLKMRVGRRRNFWVGNCVAVGLSAGFVEPLESTGLFFIDKALEVLLDYFPDADFDETRTRLYNRRLGTLHDAIRDFILLHYHVAKRDDREFWRDSRNVEIPDSLASLLEIWDETGIVETGRDMVFPDVSFFHILSGAGRLPRRSLPRADFSPFDKVLELFDIVRRKNDTLADDLPDHAELMDWLHGAETQKTP